MTSLSTLDPVAVSSREEHVRLHDLWHRYPGMGERQATLCGIDLTLRKGELVGLLGPSGCGKTTLLRLIAGLERPERGVVTLAGRAVAGSGHWLAPERRGVGMVFQDYALFPHLTAWQNAGFGLGGGRRRLRSQERLRWLLELVGLAELADRYPHELSGGQRQRLALVRALAPEPSVLLLDEPFSNLDVEVRRHLRSELPALLRACGTSGVLVTHDPEEALAICDRIAVLRDGVLQQCASPRELLSHPANPFIGRFVLQANLLPVDATDADTMVTACGPVHRAAPAAEAAQGAGPRSTTASSPDAEPWQLMVASDGLELLQDPQGPGEVVARECQGRSWLVQVRLGALVVRVLAPLDHPWQPGDRCRVRFASEAELRLYPGGASVRAR